ncbi:MAG: DUF3605 domain-containing protein [Candidatus Liptonbacteria bacterium]|nr:DUF3605 domain-containing protein [Candidatus Liptonbacteria bacterium]
MALLRSKELHEKYLAYIAKGGLSNGCVLCTKPPITDFTHWKIVLNDFPYDKFAQIHHMIVPRRHIAENELSEAEKEEFQRLKAGHINENYDFMIEPTYKLKSIPSHFHIHLLVIKDDQ